MKKQTALNKPVQGPCPYAKNEKNQEQKAFERFLQEREPYQQHIQ